MNIPLIVRTPRGYVLVCVVLDEALWTHLLTHAVHYRLEEVRRRAQYEHARTRHLKQTEEAYVARLLSRLHS